IIAPAIAWAVVDACRCPETGFLRTLLIASLLLMEPVTTDLVGPSLRNFFNEHGCQPAGALLFLVVVVLREVIKHISISTNPLYRPYSTLRGLRVAFRKLLSLDLLVGRS